MLDSHLDIIKGTKSRTSKEAKLLKRKYVAKARSVISMIPTPEITELSDIRRFLVRHQTFVNAVSALWFLGFWPDQIADFIGAPVTEEYVFGALRRLFAKEQERLINNLISILEKTNE
jgi:hypothetical protein